MWFHYLSLGTCSLRTLRLCVGRHHAEKACETDAPRGFLLCAELNPSTSCVSEECSVSIWSPHILEQRWAFFSALFLNPGPTGSVNLIYVIVLSHCFGVAYYTTTVTGTGNRIKHFLREGFQPGFWEVKDVTKFRSLFFPIRHSFMKANPMDPLVTGLWSRSGEIKGRKNIT